MRSIITTSEVEIAVSTGSSMYAGVRKSDGPAITTSMPSRRITS